jgi:putative membrane protein
MDTESTRENKKRTFHDYLALTGKGFCMGASDVVPGVSGGTMAFILGIYDELIFAIKSFDLQSLRFLLTLNTRALFNRVKWRFLLSVGIGIFTAVFTLARILSWLLQNRPVLIWSFFFGLILASVVVVSRRVEKWSASARIALLAGAVGAYILVGLVPISTPDQPWFLFLCGAVAICAMILPGISGSFILVLLGKYHYVLEAVNQRDLLSLSVVAAGACVGIAAFSRLLGWLIRNYHDLMVACLTGLMLGSLRKVWPWKETFSGLEGVNGKAATLIQANILPAQWDGGVLSAISLMVLGLAAVLLLERLGNRSS